MSENTNKTISGSSYDLQEKWLNEIAPKYFPGVDLSVLRVGLFGYINEIMGTAIEDDYFRTNFLANETMLSTARTAKAIYEYANRYNITDINATPGTVDLVMYVPIKEMIMYKVDDEDTSNISYFEFSKNAIYWVDGTIPFMQNNTIQIQIRPVVSKITEENKYNSENYSFSVRYLVNDSNELGELSSPYLKSFKVNIANTEYLVINITLYQVQKEVKNFIVYSENTVDLINFEAEYSGQLSSFNVNYIESDNKTTRLTKIFNGYNVQNLDDDFCYYKYDGDNKLQIYFSGLPEDFRPSYNTTLNIEMFTTLGEDGNFDSYNNESIDYQIDNDDPIRQKYSYQDNQLPLLFSINGGCKGGVNKLSLDEIRQKTITESSTRSTITTEINLNSYFNSIIEQNNKNGTILRFFKKVDDILERLYAAYFVLFDNDKQCIPTNTVNLKLNSKNAAINLRDPDKENLNFALNTFNINIKSNTQFTIIKAQPQNISADEKLIINVEDGKYIYDEELTELSKDAEAGGLSKHVSYVTAKKEVGFNDFTTTIFDSSISSTNSPLNETSIVNNSYGSSKDETNEENKE